MPDKNGYMYDRDAVFKAFKDWKERNKITGEVYGQLEHGGNEMKLTTSQMEALCLKPVSQTWLSRHYKTIDDCKQLSEDDVILVRKRTHGLYGTTTEYTIGKFISAQDRDYYQVIKYYALNKSNNSKVDYIKNTTYNNYDCFEFEENVKCDVGLLSVDEKTLDKIVAEYSKEESERIRIKKEKDIQARKDAEAQERMKRELEEQHRKDAEAYRLAEIERRSKPYTMTVGEYEDIKERISWLESMVEN